MAGEHDTRYKFLFSHPIFVQRLMEAFVKERFVRKLDFDSLERVDKSFITDDFKTRESDIIWKINYTDKPLYLFLLIEFQSTVDHSMPLRFLRYITEFYQSFHQTTDSGRFPAVFPILIYNGDRRWTASFNSRDLIEQSIPEKYIPSFQYYPVIENQIPKQSLAKIKNALSAVFYAENSSPEELEAEIDIFLSIITEEKLEAVQLLVQWLNNFFASVEEQQKQPVLSRINDIVEVKSMLLTKMKEHDQMMLEQGIKQGVEQGEKQRAVITAKKMLAKGYSIQEISELTGLRQQEIQALRD
ncbi:Rpn family recombination-promoting nuclease/putative transposase [Sediminispirochaeta bajacaliforniensis]|uniref:Rpn family recombination-promoting nuclease/putative transposase n=1 Tax=Sediminispirochaeta bajacaliforniensis TaxID=148 RepID=UPI0003624FF4|nr:Rpn family recombination-promoting nuclease/putative transposase [Sediminispirochaeta bajacaliforniensis]